MVTKPNAPVSAVEEIVKTFRGGTLNPRELKMRGRWVVEFDNSSDSTNVLNLINMLQGWGADNHPNAKNALRIFEA
jgi:hypothetical protein